MTTKGWKYKELKKKRIKIMGQKYKEIFYNLKYKRKKYEKMSKQ